jgi:type II secretory pathway pseudopilin PulG
MKKNKQKFTSGFTLVEIMVATSIFITILLVVMGSLVSAADSSKKAHALQEAMDNVNFAIDNMSRTLRISSRYSCVLSGHTVNLNNPPVVADCRLGGPNFGSLIEFVPPTNLGLAPLGTSMAYQTVARPDLTNTLQRCTKDGCVDIVSSDVDVEMLKFFVNGSSPADTTQPSVYIIMKGTITVKGSPTSFSIQTLASQRSTEE